MSIQPPIGPLSSGGHSELPPKASKKPLTSKQIPTPSSPITPAKTPHLRDRLKRSLSSSSLESSVTGSKIPLEKIKTSVANKRFVGGDLHELTAPLPDTPSRSLSAPPGSSSSSSSSSSSGTSRPNRRGDLLRAARDSETNVRKKVIKTDLELFEALLDPNSGLNTGGTSVDIVRKAFDVSQHPVMKAFRADDKPKLLLVPEGHGSKETLDARGFIAQIKEIHSFSEGETGDDRLGGIRGIEKPSDFEIAPILRENKNIVNYKIQADDDGSFDRDTPEKVIKELKDLGVSKEDIELVKKLYFREVDSIKKDRAITFFQNERRDLKLVQKIENECKLMKNDNKQIGVAFFGATHIVDTYDTKEDHRTSELRIPQLLYMNGTPQKHCIKIKGVNVYIYPHVMESNSYEDPYFKDFFKHLIPAGRTTPEESSSSSSTTRARDPMPPGLKDVRPSRAFSDPSKSSIQDKRSILARAAHKRSASDLGIGPPPISESQARLDVPPVPVRADIQQLERFVRRSGELSGKSHAEAVEKLFTSLDSQFAKQNLKANERILLDDFLSTMRSLVDIDRGYQASLQEAIDTKNPENIVGRIHSLWGPDSDTFKEYCLNVSKLLTLSEGMVELMKKYKIDNVIENLNPAKPLAIDPTIRFIQRGMRLVLVLGDIKKDLEKIISNSPINDLLDRTIESAKLQIKLIDEPLVDKN